MLRREPDDGASVSIWMATARTPRAEPLDYMVEADVCVIGAGIAGLSTAYMLARAGYSVVVLERGAIGGGETQRTTAHLSNAIDDFYCEIERMHGMDGARAAAESHTAAIDRIESIAGAEGIDCGFERVDGYLCLGQGMPRSVLEAELAAANRAGLYDVEYLEHGPPGGLAGPCLRFPRQAQFHPLHYLTGLAAAVARHGGRIHTDTHVSAIEDGERVRVKSARGGEVSARFAVVATNTPIHERVALHAKQIAYRTYALAIEVAAGAVPRALYWDTLDPYHYVRVQSGPDPRNELLLVGGEDHRAGPTSQSDANVRYTRLERWARHAFKELGAVRFRWSGEVMEPFDGVAFIGPSPGGSRSVLLATGDSGMGLTHGTIAGILLTDLIAGRVHPWASLYAPSRKPSHSILDFLRENGRTLAHYASWLRPGERDITAIAPGTGAIIQDGLRKLAVYRDESGDLHARSARCTHLGGLVGWNEAEKTWDCPCHGARYDRFGRVLRGPANADLAAVALLNR